ncbi:RNA polymerase sigma factor [Sinomicrobium soli]|uniref:RNA polymerase sigma factor n=1 Tax=Sinomicrobium sp. N-1-3-6 TaxID=2219864 RepID=UPI000DCB8C57|nr:sigma-70 family RNA polymerase sigma factor [Sinomicrobium sp. N-1-3-6]RAV28741.1 hypothetical protein DN748_12390 [Sinomicrobium sp. N-1-3-6]
MEHVSDSMLAQQLLQDSESAFTLLYQRYTGKIRGFLLRLRLDKHSDDIIQETFITIWNRRHTIEPSGNISAYIFTIAKNHALKYLKEEWQLLAADRNITEEEDIEAVHAREAIHRALETSMDKLPERARQVLILKRIKGYSTEEIALELGISKSTVENHMNRALTILREELSGFSAIGIVLLGINVFS